MWFILLHKPLLCRRSGRSVQTHKRCRSLRSCNHAQRRKKQLEASVLMNGQTQMRWSVHYKKVWIHVIGVSAAWWETWGGPAPRDSVFFCLRNWTKRPDNRLVSGWSWSTGVDHVVTIKITLLKYHLETLHTSLEPLISNNTSLSDPKPNSSDPRSWFACREILWCFEKEEDSDCKTSVIHHVVITWGQQIQTRIFTTGSLIWTRRWQGGHDVCGNERLWWRKSY